MTETFYSTSNLSKETLRIVMQRSNHPALLRFVILYLLFLLTTTWIILAWNTNWGNVIASQLTFGVIGCSMFACEHESVHNTAFKSRKLNKLVAFLAGVNHLYPSSLFRELHFTHHRYTHVPGKDPEISLGNRPVASVTSNLPSYLSWLSGIPLLLFKVLMVIIGALGMPEPIRKSLYPFVNPKVRWLLMLECILILSIYGGVVILALQFNSGFWAILVGQFVAHCLLTYFVTAEHNGLSHEGDIMDKTRSTQTNSFVKLLMWNMPYHAEHHAYPAVPFFALPQLHKELQSDIKHLQNGYPKFHGGVFKKLLKFKQSTN